jgi:hypothetical protein
LSFENKAQQEEVSLTPSAAAASEKQVGEFDMVSENQSGFKFIPQAKR